jgi:hypothetical protein
MEDERVRQSSKSGVATKAGLFAVAVVVDVSTLQGDCVLRERATLRSLGRRLRLASSRL